MVLFKSKNDLENMNFDKIYESDSIEYIRDYLLSRCMNLMSGALNVVTLQRLNGLTIILSRKKKKFDHGQTHK